ncbi:general stress protein [Marinococcus halotolerans]|jgi:hypothetical protein|uniref:general stress protein n=1 Tax=Marinococcus halotolerans TaxID=301092 RepID=UPI0003B37CF6|nr:general stress protein [Marinococcus halotolerans]
MKPFVREYTNDEALQQDVQRLAEKGIDKSNVYVMTHDNDRTGRIAENANANTVGMKEEGLKNAVGNMFSKKGDELRNKLQEIGLSQEEAHEYEDELDEGKILLIVTDTEGVNTII